MELALLFFGAVVGFAMVVDKMMSPSSEEVAIDAEFWSMVGSWND